MQQLSVPRFALNHMAAPLLPIAEFFALSQRCGCTAVEIRNDIAGNAILDGTTPDAIRAAAEKYGQTILTINALQRFNEWNDTRAAEAEDLAAWCAAVGAQALILVPKNDGTGCGDSERMVNLRAALTALAPILQRHGIMGFVEPLGFEICSLRLKSEAAAAITDLGLGDRFRITHDTFHHHLAGEAAIFPALTGLVHISGVSDPDLALPLMLDAHRVLVDVRDRLDNVGQIAGLIAAGVTVHCSFEPFASEVHNSADIEADLGASMEFIRSGLAAKAA